MKSGNDHEGEPREPLTDEGLPVELDLVASERSSSPVLVDPGELNHRGMEPMFSVSPRAIAVVSLIFGVSCLIALVVVTATRSADVLSTVALVLATVAFGVQLLISSAQNQSTTQQGLRSEQLNTQTRALLAEMQTTSRGTEAMVREQFGQLLRAFMDAANSAAGKHFDEAEFERRLLTNIRREAAIAQPAAESTPTTLRAATTTERIRRSNSPGGLRQSSWTSGPFPTEEEAQPVLADLLALSSAARDRLRSFGEDDASEGGGASYVGYRAIPNSASAAEHSELEKRGLIHLVQLPPTENSNGLTYQLTDKGRLGAKVVGATGDVPEWARPLLSV